MKRIVSILMLAAIFSVAVFATTTAIPKFDKAAVVTNISTVTVDRKQTRDACNFQNRTQETVTVLTRSKHPLIFENQITSLPGLTGYG